MNRLLFTLLLLSILGTVTLAQATPHQTPLITQTALASEPVAEATPEGTAVIPTDDAALIEIIVDILPDVTAPIVSGMGNAFQNSTFGGAVMWIVFGLVVTGAMLMLYRSTPPTRREDIGRDLATGASTVLKQIDQIDPLKWTDIENRILKLFSTVIDQAVASGLQAAIDAEKEKLRANAAAKIANTDLNDPRLKG